MDYSYWESIRVLNKSYWVHSISIMAAHLLCDKWRRLCETIRSSWMDRKCQRSHWASWVEATKCRRWVQSISTECWSCASSAGVDCAAWATGSCSGVAWYACSASCTVACRPRSRWWWATRTGWAWRARSSSRGHGWLATFPRKIWLDPVLCGLGSRQMETLHDNKNRPSVHHPRPSAWWWWMMV